VLVNGFDAWVETPGGGGAITSQRYAPGALFPDGARRLERFDAEPWPRWRFLLAGGVAVDQELFVPHGQAAVVLRWRLTTPCAGAVLRLRPFFSARDYHALHHENPAFAFTPERTGERLVWRPYDGVPAIASFANATYAHDPTWYRQFLYTAERERGLECVEDLASPGVLRWEFDRGAAVWILCAEGAIPHPDLPLDGATAPGDVARCAEDLAQTEERRRAFGSRLQRAADAYIVRRGAGRTIIAGYPWFTDWGRDTFIALRGLCLAGDRLDDARAILLAWAGAVSEGMLPNRFADRGEAPEFNSVDASLWYAIAVHEYVASGHADAGDVATLRAAHRDGRQDRRLGGDAAHR